MGEIVAITGAVSTITAAIGTFAGRYFGNKQNERDFQLKMQAFAEKHINHLAERLAVVEENERNCQERNDRLEKKVEQLLNK